MAAFAPLAGKFGRVQLASTPMYLAAWDFDAKCDDIDTSNFESAVDPINATIVYAEGICGMTEADIGIRGRFDGGNNPTKAPYLLWPGSFPNGFFGLTKTFGFTCATRVLGVRTGTEARQAGNIEGRLKNVGLITRPT